MKKLIALVALATIIALPAAAKTRSTALLRAPPIYASAPFQTNAVIINGVAVGWDPDPNVRLMLRRDAEQGID
jgi:hypothetical protein